VPGGRLGGGEDRPHVDRPQPVSVFDGHLLQRAADDDAGVVDQDVQPAEFPHGLLDRSGDRGGVGVIGLDDQDPAAVGVDLLGHRLRLAGGGDVGERHRGPVVGQPLGDGRADAAAAARHQCHLSG